MDDEILEIFLEEGKERLANVARARLSVSWTSRPSAV